jgi:hypothetical protein
MNHILERIAAASVVAACLVLSACSGGNTAPEGQTPATLSRVGADGQSAVVGRTLTSPLSLKVLDAKGRPVSGVSVSWSVIAGGGMLSPASSSTDDQGVASTQWTLGTEPGEHKATGVVGSLPPVTFTATAHPVPVAHVRISSLEDSIFVDQTRQLSAVVEDSAGNVLNGRSISWSSSDTARAGVSTTGLLTIKRAGPVTITAQSGGTSGIVQTVGKWTPGLPFAYRAVKLWVTNNPPGQVAEYMGQPLDRSRFESWKDVFAQARRAGVNDVVIMGSIGAMERYTDNRYSDSINYNLPDTVIIQFAADARAHGLTVSFNILPNVHGVIGGENASAQDDRPHPSDPVLWFQDHRRRILQWARLAQQLNARSFVPFTDIDQHLLRNPVLASHWLELIREIRQEYTGILTTGWWTMGWDHPGSLTTIPTPIIQALDAIGVGFVPDLVHAEEPDVATLCRGYFSDVNGRDVIGYLRGLSVRYGKPIWITDKPFHSFKGASYEEHRVFDKSIPLVPDEDLQARLYESFLSVMATEGSGWLQGVAFQNFNNLVDGMHPWAPRYMDGPLSESPQHKKAEQVMSDWFNNRRGSSCPLR